MTNRQPCLVLWLGTNRKVLCGYVTRLRRKRLRLAIGDGSKHGLVATDLFAARHGELSGLLGIEGDVLPLAFAREHGGHLDMAVAGFHRKVHRPSSGNPVGSAHS